MSFESIRRGNELRLDRRNESAKLDRANNRGGRGERHRLRRDGRSLPLELRAAGTRERGSIRRRLGAHLAMVLTGSTTAGRKIVNRGRGKCGRDQPKAEQDRQKCRDNATHALSIAEDCHNCCEMRSLMIGVALLAITPLCVAQVMASGEFIAPERLGLPPQPPAMSLMDIANPGKLVTDRSIIPQGKLAEVLYEELRATATPAGPAGEVEASRRTRYDAAGRIVEIVENQWGRETVTTFRYEADRLVRMETAPRNASPSPTISWSAWEYDQQGHVVDFRRGQDARINNHESGFRYDTKGRLQYFEYRQGEDDKLFSRTEIIWKDSRTVTVATTYDSGGGRKSLRTLDDEGRVVRVQLETAGPGPKLSSDTIDFRYDTKGRLVEQRYSTDRPTPSELDPPPGTLTIEYDDTAHTRTAKFSEKGATIQSILI